MSGIFWETLADADAVAVDVLGEEVEIGGVAMLAVVQAAGEAARIVPGGVSAGVTMVLHVSKADGEAVADGALVEARGLSGRVVSKTHHGSGWEIQVGPENRWEEGGEF
jgi:hypothetical protein